MKRQAEENIMVPKIILLVVVLFVAFLLLHDFICNNESDNDVENWSLDDVDKNKWYDK